MKKFKILFFILAQNVLAFSQSINIIEKEIEYKLNNNIEEDFNVIPLNKDGLLVFNTQSDTYGRDLILNFSKLDTSLNILWNNTFKPEYGFYVENQYQNNSFFYILLKKEKGNEIIVTRLDLQTGELINIESKLLTGLQINSFKAIKNKLLFAGIFNDKPVVEMLNIFDLSSKVLPNLYDKNFDIRDLEINEDNETIYVMLNQIKNCNYIINSYNYEGKFLNSFTLGEKNKIPLNGQILTLPNNLFVMAGNYSNNCSNLSSGFYIHPLNFEMETKYYDFSTFKNLFRYLPPKKKEKMNSRIQSKKAKGKDNIIKNRVLLHPIEPYENGFVLVGEIYFPEFKSTMPIYTGVPISTDYIEKKIYQNYNNFRFTSAIIAVFDEKGNLNWENSFNLNNLESQVLYPKVQISYLGNDNFLMAYPDQNKIKTEKINANTVIDSAKISNLDEMKTSPFNIKNLNIDLLAWYDGNFLAYGDKSFVNPGSQEMQFFFSIKKIKPILQNPQD